MPLSHLSNLCSDFLLENYPDAQGGHLADLMAAAMSESESLVQGTPHALTDQHVRAHLHNFFDGYQVEPGLAERRARVGWYQDLCSEWVSDLDTDPLSPVEVAFAIDIAVSDARGQMNEGRWPSGELARGRMHWLLRQAINRLRRKGDPGGK
ncbi:hypothetical protein [Henriciella pelagia]|uniref:hypothetical protein n=1 Tax=Henriciella pelagia TaxID=1977912 RepID=UPI003518EF2F